MEEISPPNLKDTLTHTPYNSDFKDFYHSKAGSLAEARYVFQQGNQLPFRWKNRSVFTIAETGFGTGLNFLTTWQAWQENPEKCGCLHYISIEKHPLPARTLDRLLAPYPELRAYTDTLLQHYPPLLTGFQRLNLANGRIRLTLCFMDVATALNELSMAVDCWYLDGFAPAKNPAMWSPQVMNMLGGHSKPGTTLATYTAAGAVRRHMQAAGWQVAKREGFGGKREMLVASWPDERQPDLQHQPWFALPKPVTLMHERTATVIGGGIAGCQIAHTLATRNWHVCLIERHPQLAQEASGNPAGIIGTKMTAQASWGERFYRQAFLYTLRQLAMLEAMGLAVDWHACGNLQLNHSTREQQRWQLLKERGLPQDFIQFPDATQASALAGISLNYGGSFFPQAGWIAPRSFCQALSRHPNIEIIPETRALAISSNDRGHQVSSSRGILATSNITIITNGRDSPALLSGNHLPLSPVRGQTSIAQGTEKTFPLRTTLGHEGYLTPAINSNGQHVFGATFDRDEAEPVLSETANQTNWQQLHKYLPVFAAELTRPVSAHAAIRMTTPDRYPYIGPLPDDAFYRRAYADIHYGKQYKHYPEASYHPGLFLMTGFGARGLTTSALCAELLACLINGEPLPVERSLYYQLHPARFLVKKLKQKPINSN